VEGVAYFMLTLAMTSPARACSIFAGGAGQSHWRGPSLPGVVSSRPPAPSRDRALSPSETANQTGRSPSPNVLTAPTPSNTSLGSSQLHVLRLRLRGEMLVWPPWRRWTSDLGCLGRHHGEIVSWSWPFLFFSHPISLPFLLHLLFHRLSASRLQVSLLPCYSAQSLFISSLRDVFDTLDSILYSSRRIQFNSITHLIYIPSLPNHQISNTMLSTIFASALALAASVSALTPANTANPPSGNPIGHPGLGELIPAGMPASPNNPTQHD